MQDDMHPNILRMLEGTFLPDVIQLVIEIYITAFFSCLFWGLVAFPWDITLRKLIVSLVKMGRL